MMKKYLILLILIILPGSVLAQTAGDAPESAAQPIQNKITVPGQDAPGSAAAPSATEVNITITGKNKTTGRLLGGIEIAIEDTTDKNKATTPDPPNPDGDKVFAVTPGKYTITANRFGYKTLSEQMDFSQGQTELKISIDMEPLSSTPNPETEFARRIQLIQLAQMSNPTSLQYPYNQTSNYQNPLLNQYGVNNYQYPNNLSNATTNGLYNQSNYSQNGYLLTANQQAVIPFVANLTTGSFLNSYASYDIQIVDPQTSSVVSLLSANNSATSTNSYLGIYPTLNRYGCLKQNQTYILRVISSSSTAGVNNPAQEYQFQSATLGNYTLLSATEQQIGLSIIGNNPTSINPQVQNLPLQNVNIPITCPTSYNGVNQTSSWPTTLTQNGANGTTTWSDQTFNPASFGNYHVEKPTDRAGYFLVSNISYTDTRPITFVENNSGEGGLAFVPAQSGNLYSSYGSSQWYVTTYTRNIQEQVSKCKSYLDTLVKMTQFTTLTAAIQSTIKNDISTIAVTSSDTAKSRLTLCNKDKAQLVSSYQSQGATIPAFAETSTNPTLNLTKLTRVNFSPQEYATVVAGEPLQDFK